MATLATFFEVRRRFRRPNRGAGRSARPDARSDSCRLRALPNEDIYLIAKTVDNSRAGAREPTPAPGPSAGRLSARRACLRHADQRARAQRRRHHWRATSCRHSSRNSSACSTSAACWKWRRPGCSARRAWNDWPRGQKMVTPAPGQVVHLDPSSDGTVAMNLEEHEKRGGLEGRAAGRLPWIAPCMEPAARIQAVRRHLAGGGAPSGRSAIFGPLFYLQVVQHDEYARLARQQQLKHGRDSRTPRHDLRPHRPAAGHERADGFGLRQSAPDSRPRSGCRHPLAASSNLDRPTLYGRLKWAADNHRGFLWIKRKITPERPASCASLKLDWIEFETESQRHYPEAAPSQPMCSGRWTTRRGKRGHRTRPRTATCEGTTGTARMLTDVKRRGIESQLAKEPKAWRRP